MRALGCDVSSWNSKVDFAKMKAAGAAFVGVKASQQSIDSRFKEYWPAAKAAGLPRMAYHYLDWRVSELTQAKLFTDAMAGDWGELPPVCDFEMTASAPSPAEANGKLWNFLQAVEKTTGKVPMIYTGYYYWLQYGTPNAGWLKYPLWLAWYANESIVKVPPPWKAWTFWQYDGNGNGPLYGSQGLSMDMNWYSGTIEDLKKFIGAPVTPPIQPPQPTGVAYKTIYPVNVRSDKYRPVYPEHDNTLGQLPKDTVVMVDTSKIIIGGYTYFISVLGEHAFDFPKGAWIFTEYLKRV